MEVLRSLMCAWFVGLAERQSAMGDLSPIEEQGPSQVWFSSSAKSINYIWDLNTRHKWYMHSDVK
jgi:hypothetical protein